MTVLEMKVEALMKCVPQDALEKAMTEVFATEVPVPAKDISAYLTELGTPAHIKGYRYVAYAIELAVADESLIYAITSELYPLVAERYNTTASRVERAIRHAVEVTWDRGDIDTLVKYFGNTISHTKCKPTNSEFIAQVANIIRGQGK